MILMVNLDFLDSVLKLDGTMEMYRLLHKAICNSARLNLYLLLSAVTLVYLRNSLHVYLFQLPSGVIVCPLHTNDFAISSKTSQHF